MDRESYIFPVQYDFSSRGIPGISRNTPPNLLVGMSEGVWNGVEILRRSQSSQPSQQVVYDLMEPMYWTDLDIDSDDPVEVVLTNRREL